MRQNNYDGRRAFRTGATGPAVDTVPRAGGAVQRKTVRDGLRILARIIARAHLRRQGKGAAPPRPAPGRMPGGGAVPKRGCPE